MQIYADNDNDLIVSNYSMSIDGSPIEDAVLTLTIVELPAGIVTDATNANPIEITTSTAHGLADGDIVAIVGVEGNRLANGTFEVSDLTGDNTFEIDVDAEEDWIDSDQARWYRVVPGADNLEFVYHSSVQQYRLSLPASLPLVAETKYLEILDAANYGDHWEIDLNSLVRRG